ncbi:hypothetical protein ACFWWT_08680 [Streptomyces sp. NPDC058676]|uniref:hypothetical protein n=1 Tax=unclassified Streptomyces TaxID=2593676 RepID=UPI0036483D5C
MDVHAAYSASTSTAAASTTLRRACSKSSSTARFSAGNPGSPDLVYAKDRKLPPCYGDAEATTTLRGLYNQAGHQFVVVHRLLLRLKATDPALTSKTPPPDLNRLLGPP